MEEESELIEAIEAYRCKKCYKVLTCSREEALEHAEIPVDSPLPEGLVLKSSCDIIWYVASSGDFTRDSDERLLGSHSFMHYIDSYFNEGDLRGYSGPFHRYQKMNSKDIKERLKNGKCFLLTQEEFEKFKEASPKLELVRTTPELEALVAEGVGSE